MPGIQSLGGLNKILDGEVEIRFGKVPQRRLDGAGDHLLDCAFFLRTMADDLLLRAAHGAYDVSDTDEPGVASKPIAALLAAFALQDAATCQDMEHRLEISYPGVMPRRDVHCAHGPITAMDRNIDHDDDRHRKCAAPGRPLWLTMLSSHGPHIPDGRRV